MRKKQRWMMTMSAMLILALGAMSKTRAFAAEGVADAAGAEAQVRSFIEAQVKTATANYPGRVEVTVGSLDPRLQVAACRRVEPFMQNGTRLWGKAHVGLRCREGAAWTVYLPIEVRIYGQAIVATRPLAAGQTLGQEDFRVEEVELTREAPGALTDIALVEDRVAARAIPVGALLRAEFLKVKPVVVQGDMVKVVFLGDGFAIASEGKALASAAAGQAVRVQMDSGRIVSGTARDGRRVELR